VGGAEACRADEPRLAGSALGHDVSFGVCISPLLFRVTPG
jgi:hypothetical protein